MKNVILEIIVKIKIKYKNKIIQFIGAICGIKKYNI